VLPLQFLDGQDIESLGLTGQETFDIGGVASDLTSGKRLTVHARGEDGSRKSFEVVTRIDTAVELDYYRHGGILQYVLRQLVRAQPA
jgi:aconitate hydratase